MVLSTKGRSNECPLRVFAGENNIAWFITHLQRFYNTGQSCQSDNTDRVTKMINHPDLIIVLKRDGYGLHANHHCRLKAEPIVVDTVNLEAVCGNIRHSKTLTIGR